MTNPIKVAVMGCGHIGLSAIHAVKLARDMTLVGAVELENCLCRAQQCLPDVTIVSDVQDLPEKPDVVILCVPTRTVESTAPKLLASGIRTVDCFDMHGDPFMHLRATLSPIAQEHQTASIMAAGVDPGVSTMIRALFEVWAPTGLTYVSYGPGMSMGHTVAAKAVPGVRDALAITRPGDPGCHKREVYLELEPDADFEQVKAAILADSYFRKDDVRIFQVDEVAPLVDTGHAIHILRKGGASGVDNQLLRFETTFNNPPSTAQVMVSCARAVLRMPPGAYTMLEVPLLYFLPEDVESLMKRLV